MFNFWKTKNNSRVTDVTSTAKTQLDKHREVFESLRDYDEGKKEIHTTNVQRHLQDLYPTI